MDLNDYFVEHLLNYKNAEYLTFIYSFSTTQQFNKKLKP
ncbi:hypothetical protein EVA_02627 [gut metagenome]|uniref:Uncharacterized protein n=1 Tax=gut metagenome TaxID=749906 RepID=J9D8W4_9ZZZZ